MNKVQYCGNISTDSKTFVGILKKTNSNNTIFYNDLQEMQQLSLKFTE